MNNRKVVTFSVTSAGSACIRTGSPSGGTGERVFALPGHVSEVGRKWAGFAGDRDIARIIFPFLAGLCADFLEAAREEILASEVVVFDGPWAFPPLRGMVEHGKHLVVYRAQAFEGGSAVRLFREDSFGNELARHSAATEYELSHRADLVVARSAEDVGLLCEIYLVPLEKVVVAPEEAEMDSILGRARMSETRQAGCGPERSIPTHAEAALRKEDRGSRKVALITPWDERCGIAEYSRYLVDALAMRGVECTVLARKSPGAAGGPGEGAGLSVQNFWDGDLDARGAVESCMRAGAVSLNIQYHPGFFGPDRLVELARRCRKARLPASVTLHNSREVDVYSLKKIGKMGVRLLVHNEREKMRLDRLGVDNAVFVPHGVLEVPDEPVAEAKRRVAIEGGPVIGTFGFLRPHKGLAELIKAVSILRELHEDITLVSMSALYPSDDSREYLEVCEGLVRELGLKGRVLLETGFIPIEEVVRALHACDLLVLPYHPSQEGASGAANIAIAARRPVLTTREDIFREIEGIAYQAEEAAPAVLAAAVETVLTSPVLLGSLKGRAERYATSHSWSSVADKYVGILFPDTRC